MGGRGIGKTTTFLINAISAYLKTGEQFILCRRYKNELKEFRRKDPIKDIIDGVTYRADGGGGYEGMFNGKVMFHLIALSLADIYKSTTFPLVTKVIYDEAILQRGHVRHYLPNEVEALLEFCSTVFRLRSNGKIIVLGNNIDLFNPYFSYFNVPTFKGIYTDAKRGIYCELANNSPKLIALEEKTPLHSLVEGTAYGDYHYNNALLSDISYPIMPKPSYAELFIRLRMNNDTLNIYTCDKKGQQDILYCERREKVISDDMTFTIYENNKPNYYDCKLLRERYYNFISRYFYHSSIFYSDNKSADLLSAIMDII